MIFSMRMHVKKWLCTALILQLNRAIWYVALDDLHRNAVSNPCMQTTCQPRISCSYYSIFEPVEKKAGHYYWQNWETYTLNKKFERYHARNRRIVATSTRKCTHRFFESDTAPPSGVGDWRPMKRVVVRGTTETTSAFVVSDVTLGLEPSPNDENLHSKYIVIIATSWTGSGICIMYVQVLPKLLTYSSAPEL